MGLNLRALIFHRNNKKEGSRSAYRQTCFWVSQSHSRVSQSTHLYAYLTLPSITGQTLISIYLLLLTNWRLYVERSQNLSTQALQCGVVGKRLWHWHFVLSCENYYRLYFRCERFRTVLIESHNRMFSLNFSGKHSALLIINHTSGPLYYRSKLHSTYSEPPVV